MKNVRPTMRGALTVESPFPDKLLQEIAVQMSKGCHFNGIRQSRDVRDRLVTAFAARLNRAHVNGAHVGERHFWAGVAVQSRNP